MTVIAADDRAVLTAIEGQGRYRLGPPEAPLVVFGEQDADGVIWLAEEPAGWDAPTVVTPVDRAARGHGGYAAESTLEVRNLTVVGSAAAPTARAARAARQRLTDGLLSALSGWLLYTHIDEEPARSLWVRPDGAPRVAIIDGRWLDYSFTLIAEDPIKFGEAATYGPVGLPSGDPSHTTVPWTVPLTVIGGTAPPSVTVPNGGSEWAHATYTVHGPVPSPVVELSNGELLTLDTDLGAADTAVIDTRTGLVEVNGAHRLDLLGGGSTLPLIPPGGAEVRLRSIGGGTSPSAALYVTTAPAWK